MASTSNGALSTCDPPSQGDSQSSIDTSNDTQSDNSSNCDEFGIDLTTHVRLEKGSQYVYYTFKDPKNNITDNRFGTFYSTVVKVRQKLVIQPAAAVTFSDSQHLFMVHSIFKSSNHSTLYLFVWDSVIEEAALRPVVSVSSSSKHSWGPDKLQKATNAIIELQVTAAMNNSNLDQD